MIQVGKRWGTSHQVQKGHHIANWPSSQLIQCTRLTTSQPYVILTQFDIYNLQILSCFQNTIQLQTLFLNGCQLWLI